MSLFCSKCGKEIVEGSCFCAYCGAKIVTLESQSVTVNEVVEQPKEEVVVAVENMVEEVVETVIDAEKYDVVLESIGRDVIKLSAAFKEIFADSLANAKRRVDLMGVQTLPFAILTDVTKEEAIKAKKRLCDAGATVSIKNSKGEKLSETDLMFGNEKTPDMARKEKTFKILKLVRSSIFLLCSILLVFLPLFYSVRLDANDNEVFYNYSILTVMLDYLIPLFKGEFSFSIYNFGSYFGIIYIVIVLTTMIPIIYNTCLLVYNDVLNLINKKSSTKFRKFSAWRNLGGFFADLFFVMWLVGFASKIYVARIIIILGLYLAAAIFDNVLENKKDKL